MREIKFRGKRVDNGELVYGYLFEYATIMNEPKAEILVMCDEHGTMRRFEVIPESVGQFTGLKDKNGKEIYEEDIDDSFGENMVVVYENGKFVLKYHTKDAYSDFCISWEDTNIIGNIYDNPSLLEVQP